VRRLLVPVAALGLVALVAVVGLQLLRQPEPLTAAQQASQLASELRCPDCEALSVAESRTAAAAAIRDEIAAQLSAGRSVSEIRDHFVGRYGQWILLQPMDPLVWLLPALAMLVGVAAFGWWLRASRGKGLSTGETTAPDAVERRRIRDEIEALDG
jgi:cytochrome c-type biogenesis protein CcmH/NrfF